MTVLEQKERVFRETDGVGVGVGMGPGPTGAASASASVSDDDMTTRSLDVVEKTF